MNKIAFLTGTRADYGKIKQILRVINERKMFKTHIFVTGMHMLEKFGNTASEVIADGFGEITCDEEYHYEPRMDMAISNVIRNFSHFVRDSAPNMVVVHGDRLDAIAGAIVAAFNNILVAHIEGGEISGTIDESIRHAVSKFAHLHFVANDEAKRRLIQLGEPERLIFPIGSPDIDVMVGDTLPSLAKVRERYEITFDDPYAILLYHPVVSEVESIGEYIETILTSLKRAAVNCVAIYPNNDPGNEMIREAYHRLAGDRHFRIIPSMRFEYFLTLLKNTQFIIGNSSAGVREACVYGVPAIDIGNRQAARYSPNILQNVLHVPHSDAAIVAAIESVDKHRHKCTYFGSGGSAEAFHDILTQPGIWDMSTQKQFIDLSDEKF